MKISEQPTNHILVKAHTDSEWDSCDFAIIYCGECWAQEIEKRLTAVRPFEDDTDFSSLQYYGDNASFYKSSEDETKDVLPEGRDWAFVDLEEDEEDGFIEPDNRLNCYMLVLYRRGMGLYRAYGKNTGEEFYTEELPLATIVESMTRSLKS